MAFFLGVDLGTTYTSAAVFRDGRAQTVDLGTHAPVIPSVVFLKEDETILTGEAATRRGATEPDRMAREFKRRLGDTTPLLLGGSPQSADALTARLLRSVVDQVTEREGSPPARIAVAHPANWGSYKLDLLNQAIRIADLDNTVTLSEPAAAVLHYASQERVDPGTVIAVYDLGGGTFDAAVLRKTPEGFELLGEPEGIERLGGVDFDEAIFAHVSNSLGGAIAELDPQDPVAVQAVSRLRDECVAAKEALSSDTDVSIPVVLPNISTEVRLTRAEFESMIRPALSDSIASLRRALRSAGVEAEGVDSVLLVGGSSRVPLVAQMVGAELGRPVAVDTHPKHAVALGAALFASGEMSAPADPVPVPPVASEPESPSPVAAAAAAGAVGAAGAAAATEPVPATPADPPPPVPPTEATPTAFEPTPPGSGGSKRWVWLIVAAAVVVAAIVVGAIVLSSDGDDGDSTEETAAETTTTTAAGETTTTTTADQSQETTTTVAPPPEAPVVCPPDLADLCVEILGISVAGDSYVIDWTSNYIPSVAGDHAHFFWNTFTAEQAGTNAADFGAQQGSWDLTDVSPYTGETLLVSLRPPDATQICGTAANVNHGVINPSVVHCFPLPG